MAECWTLTRWALASAAKHRLLSNIAVDNIMNRLFKVHTPSGFVGVEGNGHSVAAILPRLAAYQAKAAGQLAGALPSKGWGVTVHSRFRLRSRIAYLYSVTPPN